MALVDSLTKTKILSLLDEMRTEILSDVTTDGVPTSTTVNGHPLSDDVVISAADITTGDLPEAQVLNVIQTLRLKGEVPYNTTTSVYYNRPAGTNPYEFKGPVAPATDGTVAGGTPKAVAGLDSWMRTL